MDQHSVILSYIFPSAVTYFNACQAPTSSRSDECQRQSGRVVFFLTSEPVHLQKHKCTWLNRILYVCSSIVRHIKLLGWRISPAWCCIPHSWKLITLNQRLSGESVDRTIDFRNLFRQEISYCKGILDK